MITVNIVYFTHVNYLSTKYGYEILNTVYFISGKTSSTYIFNSEPRARKL